MSNAMRSEPPIANPKTRPVDTKLEVVVIPVSDVDRAKRFYDGLGWRLDADFANDADFRVIQFTPPGSGCAIIFGQNITAAEPGSAQRALPHRLRHRGRPPRSYCPRRRGQRGVS